MPQQKSAPSGKAKAGVLLVALAALAAPVAKAVAKKKRDGWPRKHLTADTPVTADADGDGWPRKHLTADRDDDGWPPKP